MLALTTKVAWGEGLPNPLHWLSKDTPTPVPHAKHAARPPLPTPTVSAAASLSFAAVARAAKDGVVNISTSQAVPEGTFPELGPHPEPLNEDDSFSRFFSHSVVPTGLATHALGSGVIIDKDGSIVTAAHVVKNAGKLIVTLQDKRVLEAQVAGRDDKSDIALLSIQPPGDLVVLPLGNSDALQVGEWVVALGSSFGPSETVTAGIVSTKERVIGEGPSDDVIRTDASNDRSVGGPLLNLQARVVGINSVSDGRRDGALGVGFAISINLVKTVVEQLKAHGKVNRGWLGVSVQDLTPELARSFGVQKTEGALVVDVTEESPAARGDIARGDIIVEFGGTHLDDAQQLLAVSAATPVGRAVPVTVLRRGETKSLSVILTERPTTVAAPPAQAPAGSDWGLDISDITPDLVSRFNLDHREGVVVTAVAAARAAAHAGLQPGDVIAEANRRPVHNITDYQGALANPQTDPDVLLLVERRGRRFFVALSRPG